MMFSEGENKFLEYQQNLFVAISFSLWIDENTVKELEKLFSKNNYIFVP